MVEQGQPPEQSGTPIFPGHAPGHDTVLGVTLAGSLPCVFCGYELRGLSILGKCPECGTAIRATILYQVDPQADEFQPIKRRSLTAWSLVVWNAGALLAALLFWLMRADDVLNNTLGWGPIVASWAGPMALLAIALSGAAIFGLLRPTHETRLWKTTLALVAMAAYVPLLAAVRALLQHDQNVIRSPYFDGYLDPTRLKLRLIAGAGILTIVLAIRPIARDLVRRSLALRTGRVDRQTLLAMAVVVAMGMAGDALGLIGVSMRAGQLSPRQSSIGELLILIATIIIVVASAVLTLGLISAIADSWRIRRAILMPSPSLRQVLGPQPSEQPPANPPA